MTSEYSQAERHFDLLEQLITKATQPGNEHLIASGQRQLDHLTTQFPFYAERSPARIQKLRDQLASLSGTKPSTNDNEPVLFHGEPILPGRTITSPGDTYILTSINTNGNEPVLSFTTSTGFSFTIDLPRLEAMEDLDELDTYAKSLTKKDALAELPTNLDAFLAKAFPQVTHGNYQDWEHLTLFDPTEKISFPTPEGIRELSMNARYFVHPESYGVAIATQFTQLHELMRSMATQLDLEPNEDESIPSFVQRLLTQASRSPMV